MSSDDSHSKATRTFLKQIYGHGFYCVLKKCKRGLLKIPSPKKVYLLEDNAPLLIFFQYKKIKSTQFNTTFYYSYSLAIKLSIGKTMKRNFSKKICKKICYIFFCPSEFTFLIIFSDKMNRDHK